MARILGPVSHTKIGFWVSCSGRVDGGLDDQFCEDNFHMIEWLAGISAGFAFKPILEDSPKKAQRRAARPFLAAFARAR